MPTLPSLRGLYTFDRVASLRSFSRAARELHVSQGAVSHRIRALEEEVGVALLVRSSRHVGLTAAGEVLIQATQRAFQSLREGLAELHAVGNPNRVTVSCSPSLAIRWLVPKLGELRALVPELELFIHAEDRLVDPDGVSVDLCIRFGPGGYARVESEQLTFERAIVVCSPSYAARVEPHTKQLHGCTLLHDEVLADHEGYVGWLTWLQAAGITQHQCEQQYFSHSYLALDAAAAGQGLAIARRSLVSRALADGRLVSPFSCEVTSGLSYWLISPSGLPASPAVVQFTRWLRQSIGG